MLSMTLSRRAHRILGTIVALQLLIWLATGVLFNVKHRYAEAYEMLHAPRREVAASELRI